MTRHTVFGTLWLAAGIVGAALNTYELITIALRPDVGFSAPFYEPSWWFTQALFPMFFIAAAVVGVALLCRTRWAVGGLKVLAPIMLIYATAYTIFGGERAWWWALIGLAALVFAAWSTVFAYGKRERLAI
jgi:hypothetical protein